MCAENPAWQPDQGVCLTTCVFAQGKECLLVNLVRLGVPLTYLSGHQRLKHMFPRISNTDSYVHSLTHLLEKLQWLRVPCLPLLVPVALLSLKESGI